jgi:phosphate transport system permease protein
MVGGGTGVTRRRIIERTAEGAIGAAGFASVIAVLAISLFLLLQGLRVFGAPEYPDEPPIRAGDVLLGTSWYPTSEPPRFGIVPLFLGSLMVSAGALAIAVPLGVASALFIGEVAPARLRELLKPLIEIAAAFPSIVVGFAALELIAPAVKEAFGLDSGLTALTGSLALAFLALPTIVTVAEDAIAAVPLAHREASYALGANRWQTSWRVVLPAASPGILAGVLLGVGRVVGETMAVLMVTGNAAVMPRSLLVPVRTMTATIANEMGETVSGSPHYYALFFVGAMIFVVTFVVNGAAATFLGRTRRRAEGKA